MTIDQNDGWVLRSRRVALPGGIRPAAVLVRDGVISAIHPFDHPCDYDARELIVMPGLVDTHVHVNDPGRTDWEGFASATRAAAAGGITTIIDMPLNSIPVTTSASSLETKIAAAEGECWVDVGFWGGAVPGNLGEIDLLLNAGCFGLKCFLTPSGIDEFPHLDPTDLEMVMREMARAGRVLLVHAELAEFLGPAPARYRDYLDYMNSRPESAEEAAIELLVRLSIETGCSVHVVHLSSAKALMILRTARRERVPITAETCPHYLTFAAEEVPCGVTEFKCAPPIRLTNNREALWDGLRRGLIDMVVSDHSPCLPEMKQRASGDFSTAWGGIASLQLLLPAVWTEASARGFDESDLVRWMCLAPSRLTGLAGRKGSIAPDFDADFVIWDPDEEFTVTPESLYHRHKLTPYAGRALRGVVKETYLRGKRISLEGRPEGTILRRSIQ